MIGCESKNEHKKRMAFGRDWMIRVQNFLTILDAMVNRIGGTYTIIW